ncbi:hypothetical protein [Ruminiclostridium hungatei]|nr:hypothetical protein [Ruminiclostridium hungatei]
MDDSVKKATGYLGFLQEQYSLNSQRGKALKDIRDNKDSLLKSVQYVVEGQLKAMELSPEEAEQLKPRFLQAVMEDINNIPTDYEDPFCYRIMKDIEQEIFEAAGELGIKIPDKRPVIGTLPTHRVNAGVIPVPDCEELIIAFESQIFNFANLASKVAARALSIKNSTSEQLQFSVDIEDIKKNLEQNPEIAGRFRELIIAYFIDGYTGYAPQYFLDGNYLGIASILRHSFELFVMGHEYGHIVCGHLDDSSKRVRNMLGEIEYDEIQFDDWEQEIEADNIGTSLMLHVMRKGGYDLSLSYMGVDFFFSIMDIVENGFSLMLTGEETIIPSDSHPPSVLRREVVRQSIRNSVPEEEAESAIFLGTQIEQILKILWDKTKGVLLEYFEAKQA